MKAAQSSNGDRRWNRAGVIWTAIGAVATVVGAIVYPVVQGRQDESVQVQSPPTAHVSAESLAFAAVPACAETDHNCELVDSVRLSTGKGMVTAYGVNQWVTETNDSQSSTVVIANSDNEVIWVSPFEPGHGLIEMVTDVTNNLFVLFAVTNHSGLVWVLRVTDDGIKDFGTLGGTFPLNEIGEASISGSRPLYSAREGWPANTRNEQTSRDVFVWNGSQYEYMGCEVIVPASHVGDQVEILESFGTDYEKCKNPLGVQSVNLFGYREDNDPVP